jgi:hypothetical protein
MGAAPASDGSALRAADATPSSPPQSLAVDSKRARTTSISRVRNATLGALLFQFSFPGVAAEVQKLGQKNDHQEQNEDRNILKEENDTSSPAPGVNQSPLAQRNNSDKPHADRCEKYFGSRIHFRLPGLRTIRSCVPRPVFLLRRPSIKNQERALRQMQDHYGSHLLSSSFPSCPASAGSIPAAVWLPCVPRESLARRFS